MCDVITPVNGNPMESNTNGNSCALGELETGDSNMEDEFNSGGNTSSNEDINGLTVDSCVADNSDVVNETELLMSDDESQEVFKKSSETNVEKENDVDMESGLKVVKPVHEAVAVDCLLEADSEVSINSENQVLSVKMSGEEVDTTGVFQGVAIGALENVDLGGLGDDAPISKSIDLKKTNGLELEHCATIDNSTSSNSTESEVELAVDESPESPSSVDLDDSVDTDHADSEDQGSTVSEATESTAVVPADSETTKTVIHEDTENMETKDHDDLAGTEHVESIDQESTIVVPEDAENMESVDNDDLAGTKHADSENQESTTVVPEDIENMETIDHDDSSRTEHDSGLTESTTVVLADSETTKTVVPKTEPCGNSEKSIPSDDPENTMAASATTEGQDADDSLEMKMELDTETAPSDSSEVDLDEVEVKTEVCDSGVGTSDSSAVITRNSSEKEESNSEGKKEEKTLDSSEKRKRNAEGDVVEKGAESVKKARLDDVSARLGLVDNDDEEADDPEEMDTNNVEKVTGGADASSSKTDSTNTDKKDAAEMSDTNSDGNTADDVTSEGNTADDVSPCGSPAPDTVVASTLKGLRRGTLSNISPSELEELIVQKVCESLTERSTHVGELRRRCQLLEEENDRYKEIAHSCRKQLRELDTVMKKFLAETQKQLNPTGPRQIITPIRVTRSVGLQVSIGPKKTNVSPQKNGPIVPRNVTRINQPTTPQPKKLPNKAQATTPSPISNGLQRSKQAIIRPKPNAVIPLNKRPVPSVTIAKAAPAADNGIIDLTDDPPVPHGSSKVAYLIPNSTLTKYVLAPGKAPATSQPPNLVFKARPQQIAPRTADSTLARHKHPAPLPPIPTNQPFHHAWKSAPPRPTLKISDTIAGIVLSWDMPNLTAQHEKIKSYQLYAYQEGSLPPTSSLWRQVGDVAALPLPMACTLSSFVPGHRYHFSVRAVDVHIRVGPFSFPGSIIQKK